MKKSTIMYLLIFIAIVLFVVYMFNFRMSVLSAGSSSSSSSSNAKKEDFYPGFSSDGLTNPYVSQFSNW